ncbi:MAG: glycosyltransferase family 9 protein [Candidatus Zixiibacteriota bacterium]
MAGIVEQWLKGIGRLWLRQVAPKATPMPTPLPAGELEKISRILVVRLDDRLGNIVLLTALLVALKGRFSRAHLTCLLSQRYAAMKEFIPSVDEFLIFDRAALAHNPARIRPLIKEIRQRNYDLVINASDDRSVSFNHMMITALSGGRIRVGHAHAAASRYYEVSVPLPAQKGKDAPVRHVVDMHLDLLRAITPIRSTTRPLIRRPTRDTGFGAAFAFRTKPSGKPLVLIHPGGRGPKQWKPERFAEVAKALHATGEYRIGLVWGPADIDAADIILEKAKDAINPVGVLAFDDLVSLICSATVFVAGDCGPMHLASALGTATVAIFLVSDADKYRPRGDNDVTLDGRKSRITVERVVEAVKQATEGARATAARRAAITGKPFMPVESERPSE